MNKHLRSPYIDSGSGPFQLGGRVERIGIDRACFRIEGLIPREITPSIQKWPAQDERKFDFSAKDNLEELLRNPPAINEVERALAQAALDRVEKHDKEDIEQWATSLAGQLSSFRD